jgi:hypothetical protein
MALFRRREAPPPAVVAALAPDERVVSWADAAGGRVVLATPLGLWWPGVDTEAAPRRIGWQFVTKAVWKGRTLSVVEADVDEDGFLVDREPVHAELSTPRDLPPTVRKRIEANIVRSELLAVAGGAARFVARRAPGTDGLLWWARLEEGTPDTPQVRSAVRARLAILRAEASPESR